MKTASENSGVSNSARWRLVAWLGAALLLVAVFVAMQFTDEIDWTLGDFLFAGFLLFGSLGVYEMVTRVSNDGSYRMGSGLAIAAALLLVWSNGAVGLTDSDADVLYPVVLALGLVGAVISRFRAQGMMLTMFAVATAVALTGIGAFAAGIVPPHNSLVEILGISAFFGVLFSGSALLFRQAANPQPKGHEAA